MLVKNLKRYPKSVFAYIMQSPYWLYYNPSKILEEKVYLKIIPGKTEDFENWKVERVTTVLSQEIINVGLSIESPSDKTRRLGLKVVRLDFTRGAYMRPHQRGNTCNPITKEEFDEATKEYYK